MHGHRTTLRYSPSTPSPAGARPRGRSTVLPFGSGVARSIAAWRAGGGAWGGEGMQLGLTHYALEYFYTRVNDSCLPSPLTVIYLQPGSFQEGFVYRNMLNVEFAFSAYGGRL